jgi:putative endonuclease
MGGFVYILASRMHGTLYVGVTPNLPKRVYEHRTGVIPGFTRRYAAKLLVYLEAHDSIEAAIVREKQLKEWKRDWKIELIERDNPVGRTCLHAARFRSATLPDHPFPSSRRKPGSKNTRLVRNLTPVEHRDFGSRLSPG